MAETKRITRDERFWSKVNKTETCWLWTAGVNNKGYGRFRYFSDAERHGLGCDLYAHRVAWLLTNGPIPDGMEVLHRCDTPRCVSPDHLFLGTQADNMRDASRKNRFCRIGRPARLQKLTPEIVRAIRAETHTDRHVAGLYGISYGFVNRIRRRLSYKHVD